MADPWLMDQAFQRLGWRGEVGPPRARLEVLEPFEALSRCIRGHGDEGPSEMNDASGRRTP